VVSSVTVCTGLLIISLTGVPFRDIIVQKVRHAGY
jgi:hypothetical protein